MAFGKLLKQYRHAAGLAQDDLAARAQLHTRTIQGLEGGARHRPRPATIRQLIEALGLGPEDQARLAATLYQDSESAAASSGTRRIGRGPGSRRSRAAPPSGAATPLRSAPRMFGELLRDYRRAVGQTQAGLAQQAKLSKRGVQDLERGVSGIPHAVTLHRLIEVLQLSPGDRALLEAAAQPGSLLAHPRSSLPNPATPLIGRTHEVAAIRAQLQQPGVRLLTLIGPPGIGKTRLALAAASGLGTVFPDGVAFVALAPIAAPKQVAGAIAAALALTTTPAQAVRDHLLAYVRDKRLLLVLDNFEHLLNERDLVRDLLAASPHLRLLVTSRALLTVDGEAPFVVPPLALPDAHSLPLPEYLLTVEAAALFVARACAVKRGFHLSPANADAVAAICRQLEGLPLAIELAASHCALLTPQALTKQLARRLPILTADSPDLPARQRTLRGAIAWSYELLTQAEQKLLRALGVFAGGWSFEAVLALGDDSAVGQEVLSDGLQLTLDALGHQSLVAQEDGPTGPYYRMFVTIREFAWEQLVAAGEASAAQDRHLAYFLALAETARSQLFGADQVMWLERLTTDHDNLQQALRWAEPPRSGRPARPLL